jgi:hypothetical protein
VGHERFAAGDEAEDPALPGARDYPNSRQEPRQSGAMTQDFTYLAVSVPWQGPEIGTSCPTSPGSPCQAWSWSWQRRVSPWLPCASSSPPPPRAGARTGDATGTSTTSSAAPGPAAYTWNTPPQESHRQGVTTWRTGLTRAPRVCTGGRGASLPAGGIGLEHPSHGAEPAGTRPGGEEGVGTGAASVGQGKSARRLQDQGRHGIHTATHPVPHVTSFSLSLSSVSTRLTAAPGDPDAGGRRFLSSLRLRNLTEARISQLKRRARGAVFRSWLLEFQLHQTLTASCWPASAACPRAPHGS